MNAGVAASTIDSGYLAARNIALLPWTEQRLHLISVGFGNAV